MELHNKEEIKKYVDFFVSMIVYFPEITTVKYDCETDEITYNFIVKCSGDYKNPSEKAAAIEKSVHIYTEKEYGKYSESFTVNCRPMNEFIVIECRDNAVNLDSREITLMVELLHLYFGNDIVSEVSSAGDYRYFSGIPSEDNVSIFENKRIKYDKETIGNSILVCREAGKVLVFSNS